MVRDVRNIRVLITGTFDLDNFGDLLFGLITERYFQGAEIHLGAPFGWDMDGVVDRDIQAYGPLLDTQEFDIIWTAGGQLGMDVETAFCISAPRKLYARYQDASPGEREAIIDEAAGGVPLTNAYIPSPMMFPKNAGTLHVINSIGMSTMLGARKRSVKVSTIRREANMEILRNASLVSARENETSKLFELLDVEHRLAPDLVHTIGLLEPPKGRTDSDVLIFQISQAEVDKFGLENIGNFIVQSKYARKFQIKLLVTGMSKFVNMVDVNADLADYVKRNSQISQIEVIEDRNPMKLVEHIRSARVVAGTSLHLRIVANSYQIPRVNFTNEKVEKYARFWDPDMPYGIPVSEFDEAVGVALSKENDRDINAQSERLTRLAHENMELLQDWAVETASTESDGDKLNRMKSRRRRQLPV